MSVQWPCYVTNSTTAETDAALPTVAAALDPARVVALFDAHLESLARGDWQLGAVQVMRHKPGKRCLIAYDIVGPRGPLTLIGKIQARRYGKQGLRTLSAFWDTGFWQDSADGITVPMPYGHVGALQMWLQRKERGIPLTDVLRPGLSSLMGRVARAAHKIHTAGVAPDKAHTMADELRILRERLPRVADARPELADRIAALLAACAALGTALPPMAPVPSHRDFYPDQVLVDGERLCVIDFDLFCDGDPGLDIGNFSAHITEHSLRVFGDPDALAPLERALEDAYVACAGEALRERVRVYASLTLARHVYLSTLFAERRAFTEPLLVLCEQRLGLAAPA
jgi:Phosphotransferase enzyme family